jgi:hypothetical protein
MPIDEKWFSYKDVDITLHKMVLTYLSDNM